jgi:hypothetical protein
MQTFFDIETEVEFRRCTYEREVAAEALAALACPEYGQVRWPLLPHLFLTRLRSLPTPRMRVPGFWSAATRKGLPNALFEGVPLASAAGSSAAAEPL